jgi:lipopolysaccharide/colanic/teichoic acid biosynthesis glycosyltransferase
MSNGLPRGLGPSAWAVASREERGERRKIAGPSGALAQRCLDVAVGSVALAGFLPVMAVAALAMAAESGFPVIYRQIRVGRDGTRFVLYKLRTMRQDAEANTGPVWAVDGDPRATKIGKILRRLSIDELPQLINVLKGDMSLVGPRPERPHFVGQFAGRISNYDLRHGVRPGMTGWAQVHGFRGDTSIEKRTECDLWYVCHRSLRLDVYLLGATVCLIARSCMDLLSGRPSR